jgi:hypothetical protein
MDVAQRSYVRGRGWSEPLPVELDSARTLVLAFGASDYLDDQAPLAELAAAFPRAHRVGCSTSGEIAGTRVQDGTLSVAVARFASTALATHVAPVDGTHSYDAGRALATGLVRDGLRAVLVLSDGLAVNGTELVAGINAVLPESVVVTGGLAGDGDRFRRTWVFDGRQAKSGCVVAVGLYGDRLVVGHGSKGGWDKFGPEREVTRSHGNVLHTLDGKPALTLYKEYLGDRAAGLPATALLFPLAIRTANDDKVLVRTVLAVDEAAGSMTFAGDIPQGCRAQLMRANFDRLITGAGDAALMTKHTAGDATTKLSIAISCVGRRLVLAERTEEELEATAEVLPPSSVQVGFYSYGEISPYATGRCDLHNQTMTLTVIGEAETR